MAEQIPTSSSETAADASGGMIPNVTFTKAGKPISPRLKKPEQARSIHVQMFDADYNRRTERASVQGMAANKPPFDPVKMKAAGLEGCSNIDIRLGSIALRKELAPLANTFLNTKTFMRIRLTGGDPEKREAAAEIVSEGFTRMLRSWPQFRFRYLFLASYQIAHGKSFAFWDNAHNPFFDVAQDGEILVPELTKADATDFGVASMIKEYQISDLYDNIRNATKQDYDDGLKVTEPGKEHRYRGWHVPSVVQALEKATEKNFMTANDFDLSQREWEANEIYYSRSEKVVRCILQLVTEGDGKVTQYTCTETADTQGSGDVFLYKEVNKFPAMNRALVPFFDSIGTNGYFHSVHGRGSAMFPSVRKITELTNRMIDAAAVELSIPVSGTEEAINSELAFTQAGIFLIIPPNIKMLKADMGNANYTKSSIPIMEMMQKNFTNVLGNSSVDGDSPKEIFDHFGGVDELGAVLWFGSMERLLREVLRRADNIKASEEPGGPEVFEWRKWCKEQGVDLKDYNIDVESSTAVMPIGNGSPAAMNAAMEGMKDLVGFMDEKGKNNWARAKAMSLPGVHYSQVDEFLPATPGLRPGPETKIAMMENVQLINGADPESIKPLPDEPHLLHLEQHLNPSQKIMEAVEQGQMPIEEASTKLFPLYTHMNETIEMAGDNEVLKKEVNEYRRAIEVLGEIIVNGQRKLRARQEKEAEAAQQSGQQAPQGQQGLSPQQLKSVIHAQEKMKDAQQFREIRAREAAQKLAQESENHKQKLAIKAAQAAAKMLGDHLS